MFFFDILDVFFSILDVIPLFGRYSFFQTLFHFLNVIPEFLDVFPLLFSLNIIPLDVIPGGPLDVIP